MGDNDLRTKNKVVAEEIVKIALNPDMDGRLRLAAMEMIMDRLEGKAVAINLNAEIVSNPFEDIDTSKLEALRDDLLNHEKKAEIKCPPKD